jgi:hypothetical protein
LPSCDPPQKAGFISALGTTGAGGGVVKLSVFCTTTMDTLVAGTAREGQRAVWAVGHASVRNAGSDGEIDRFGMCPQICGTGDEEPMGWAGLFLP